jgi:PAS domain S-box-containing protein
MVSILVVDDERDIVDLLRDWLTLHRYQVLTTASSLEALALAEAEHPDLILMDVVMPEMTGIEACRALRKNESTSSIPIILITGRDLSGGRMEALTAGANDYVTKPINLEDLGRRIRTLLGMQTDPLKRSDRLLEETVQAALSILPCNLAWLLTVDPEGNYLTTRVVAASGGEAVADRFLKTLGDGSLQYRIPLRPTAGQSAENSPLLIQTMINGTAQFNLASTDLRTRGEEKIFRACEELNLYFITMVPLQTEGQVLGVLMMGSFEPRDVETPRGQQLLAAIINQAVTAVDNARLMRRLAEYEMDTSRERGFTQAVLDVMGDGLLLYNERSRVVFANRRLAQMSGYSSESLTGMAVEDLCHPDHRRRLRALISDPSPSQTATSFEFDLLCTDGSVLPVQAVLATGTVSRGKGEPERVIVLSDLSEHRARERMLIKQSHRLEALSRAAQAINSTLELDDAIQIILNEATAALGAVIASVLLRPPGTEELFIHSAAGPGAEQLRGRRIPLDKSIAGFVASEGLPMLVEDAYNDHRFFPEVDSITGIKTRSIAAVPLLVQDEAVGVVQVICEEVGAFDLDDLETLQGLARSAAMAFENASLFGETQRQVRELLLLLRASEAASSTLAIETVLRTVAHQLIDALDVTWCVISSWSPDVSALFKLAEVAQVAWPAGRGRGYPLQTDPLAQHVLKTGTPAATSLDDPDVPGARRERLMESNYWAVLVLPVKRQNRVLGIVELYHASDKLTFNEADIDRCLTILSGWQNALISDAEWMDVERIDELCHDLLDSTGTAWCSALAHPAGADTLTTIYEVGQAVWPLGQGESIVLDDASLRRVALMERTAVAARLDDQHLSPVDRVSLPQIDNGALLAAPLIAHGEAIGLVQLIDIDPRRVFSDNELSLAQAIANVVGSALENGRLYSALSRRAAQLEAAYNDLRDADRLTDEMIQNISHELRTPLAPVVGYTDMLLADDLGDLNEDQRRVIEIMNAQARMLTRMVSDIVTVQNPKEEMDRRSQVSLGMLAAAAVETAGVSAQKRGVHFDIAVRDNLPEIIADEERVLQVFENLLSNAVKFSPHGGAVKIAIYDVVHSIQVDVTDQGIGIPSEETEKIWRRFYQIDGSATRSFNGLGLGLTIVKQVIEKHNGRVWVSSEPGQGSTFSFTLPKGEAAAQDAQERIAATH